MTFLWITYGHCELGGTVAEKQIKTSNDDYCGLLDNLSNAMQKIKKDNLNKKNNVIKTYFVNPQIKKAIEEML